MARILKGQYEPIPAGYSADLAALIHDMLQLDPDLRPTARDLLVRPLLVPVVTAYVQEQLHHKECARKRRKDKRRHVRGVLGASLPPPDAADLSATGLVSPAISEGDGRRKHKHKHRSHRAAAVAGDDVHKQSPPRSPHAPAFDRATSPCGDDEQSFSDLGSTQSTQCGSVSVSESEADDDDESRSEARLSNRRESMAAIAAAVVAGAPGRINACSTQSISGVTFPELEGSGPLPTESPHDDVVSMLRVASRASPVDYGHESFAASFRPMLHGEDSEGDDAGAPHDDDMPEHG